MSKVIVKPSKLSGTINIPPSKSYSHRGLIAASLAGGGSKIDNLLFSKDILATIDCLKSINVEFEIGSDYAIANNKELKIVNSDMPCNESGSTIRFMIPIAAAIGGETKFHGEGRLVSRPLDPYLSIFDKQGISYDMKGKELPLFINGKLEADTFDVPGDISSQFITGLLFALPLLTNKSEINITTKLESKNYVDLTTDIMKQFGVDVSSSEDYSKFIIEGNQTYKPFNYTIEGDYSQAAFWIVAAIIGNDLKLAKLSEQSLQGDKEIIDIAKRMGADIKFEDGLLNVKKSKTEGTIIDVAQIPDLVPILAVLASLSEGKTTIINGERVRLKESDRLEAIACELNKIGGNIKETKDGLIIEGVGKFTGGNVEGWNDHRIVMALTVASLVCSEELVINDSRAVDKSYPHFFEDFAKLGGNVNELHME